MEKITYATVIEKMFNLTKDNLTAEEQEKVRAHLIQLTKPKKKSEGPTKKQRETAAENASFANDIFDKMVGGTTYATKELADMVEISVPKAVHVMDILVNRGDVVREVVKGKTVYHLPVADAE